MRAVGVPMVAAPLAPPAVASAELESTTTINGVVPPGTPAKLADLTVLTDTVGVDGDRLLVMQGIRTAGTRAPIQYHDHAGHACVQSGAIAHYVEGAEPSIYPVGSCYDLEPHIAMTAANLGDQDARMNFAFFMPANEPNWPDLSDPTG